MCWPIYVAGLPPHLAIVSWPEVVEFLPHFHPHLANLQQGSALLS